MLIGDPYKFAIIFDRVAAWNASLSDNNGYFSFCIDGKLFPEIAINAILSVSVNDIRTSLIGIPVNETIYKMDKSKTLNKRHREALIATGVVLFVFILIINVLSEM